MIFHCFGLASSKLDYKRHTPTTQVYIHLICTIYIFKKRCLNTKFTFLDNLKRAHGQYTALQVQRCGQMVGSVSNSINKIFKKQVRHILEAFPTNISTAIHYLIHYLVHLTHPLLKRIQNLYLFCQYIMLL